MSLTSAGSASPVVDNTGPPLPTGDHSCRRIEFTVARPPIGAADSSLVLTDGASRLSATVTADLLAPIELSWADSGGTFSAGETATVRVSPSSLALTNGVVRFTAADGSALWANTALELDGGTTVSFVVPPHAEVGTKVEVLLDLNAHRSLPDCEGFLSCSGSKAVPSSALMLSID